MIPNKTFNINSIYEYDAHSFMVDDKISELQAEAVKVTAIVMLVNTIGHWLASSSSLIHVYMYSCRQLPSIKQELLGDYVSLLFWLS